MRFRLAHRHKDVIVIIGGNHIGTAAKGSQFRYHRRRQTDGIQAIARKNARS